MPNKNFIMKQSNGVTWDELYPKTMADNILLDAAFAVAAAKAGLVAGETLSISLGKIMKYIATMEDTGMKNAVNGYAGLDSGGKVYPANLPSYVDDVVEYANLAAFPATGDTGIIYVAIDTNKTYRWSGSVYTAISSGAVDSVAGKTGVVTLAKGDVGLGNVDNTTDAGKPVSTAQATAIALKANLASPTFTGTVAGITKAMVGLTNVDDTSDAAKPVSTAQATAIGLKANAASPAFTGTPTGLTKAHVGLGSVDNTADSAKPVSTAQATAIGLKANAASPAFTGTPTGLTKAHVGLGSVDNTADSAKPVSTAQATAIALRALITVSVGAPATPAVGDFWYAI